MKNGRYWAHSRIAWRVVLFAPRLPDGIHCAFSSGQEDVRVGSYGVSQIVTNCEEPILFKIEYLRSDEVDEFVRDETEEATMPAALILSDFMAMIGNCSSVTPSRDASDGRAPRTWESFLPTPSTIPAMERFAPDVIRAHTESLARQSLCRFC